MLPCLRSWILALVRASGGGGLTSSSGGLVLLLARQPLEEFGSAPEHHAAGPLAALPAQRDAVMGRPAGNR